MIIDSRIPDLSDKQLEDLHGNAVRLAQSGGAPERIEAERQLPVISREIEKRRRTKAADSAEKQALRRETIAGKANVGAPLNGRAPRSN